MVVVVIFLWGPQKIPDLARAIGKARREFDQASKEMNDAMSGKSSSPAAVPQAVTMPAPERTGDQVLIETAKQLGISTEGKTRDQISQEIVAKSRP